MRRIKLFICLALVITSVFAIAFPAYAVTGTINANKTRVWQYSNSSGTNYIAYMDKGTEVTIKDLTVKNNRLNISGDGYKSNGKAYHVSSGWVSQDCID